MRRIVDAQFSTVQYPRIVQPDAHSDPGDSIELEVGGKCCKGLRAKQPKHVLTQHFRTRLTYPTQEK